MAERLKGKVAIVTGAGRGIGKGIARLFAAEGAKVLIANRSGETGGATVEEIKAAGGEAALIKIDVSRWADAQAMAEAAIDRYGRIDILCNNAGIYPESSIEDLTEELWDQVQAVNLKGTFLTLKACLPQMKKQKYGRIVITSSITGPRTGLPGLGHYAASKGGVNAFIRTAAVELAPYNITVNGVEPGTVLTEGLQALGAEYIAETAKIIPLGRVGTVEDVAYAMLFLASDEAGFITGQTIVVDGGQILPESPVAIGQ